MANVPQYTRAHVDNCAFPSWYPALQHVSIKSEIIPLPDAFVSLLLADGVKLKSMRNNKKIQELHDDDADGDADNTHLAKATDEHDVEKHVRDQVETALKKLKGSCFPKLNWSCPRDASWMLGGMKCVNYEDVFLLLKASDFIVFDLTLAYAGCCDTATDEQLQSQKLQPLQQPTNVSLVLKKWCNFYDSMHFRCFVVNRSLVGVSQRHCDEFYDFLFAQQDHLCELIYRFFHDHVKNGFRCDRDFIFDVYVDKQHRVFLVDINVFGAVTDPLLFTWEELLEMRDDGRRRRALRGKDDSEEEEEDEEEEEEEQAVDFRIVESSTGIRANPLSSYRTPTDFVDHLAATGGFDAFIDQVRRDNADSSDEDEDEEDDQDEDEDEDDVRWGSDNDDYD